MDLSELWEIVETEEPDVLQSMGSQRVGHDLVTEKQQLSKMEFFFKDKKYCA